MKIHTLPSLFFFTLIMGVFSSFSVHASSSDAWEEFEQAVRTQCSIQFDRSFSRYHIYIDPYGTESYGMAIARGKLKSSTGLRAPDSSMVCIYNKRSKQAEVGQSFNSNRLD
ncbi:hypothetical protein C9J48_15195 [Photobacterium profundum]|uniref:Uncharacterized protein n=1 Tax=Photobacterium profundum 3TCK TaxID=314280 RepID=Q1YZV0_9GAMM|nr:hypothetical protein [Photobacterium profundum]EAS41775.1 hypothetical protein P3TCK_01135 [Photobacterium profundum 3TCK]PSV61600.1 hypothetical protein C9J48_15195 [Photobacterium profundum]